MEQNLMQASYGSITGNTGVPSSRTSTEKPHYPVLDGLRGVAALLVVVFHLFEAYYPDYALHPIHHGYLAVDFFFLLSGFVVGYAYDDRWGRMTVRDFFRIRLIRLQPLVVLGVLLGLIGFYIDPFNAGKSAPVYKVVATTLLALVLLPGPDIRGWGETHPLNGPCWSLLQEYIANILYAIAGRRMGLKALTVVAMLSAAALVAVATSRPNIGTGWSYDTFPIAVVRMLFPFTAGLLLFRSGFRIRVRGAFALCALALTGLFVLPAFRWNGLYESACIIVAFPLIVALGAGAKVSAGTRKACGVLGRLSYPLYILHYPFIYGYTAWVYLQKPAPAQVVAVAAILFLIFLALAWAALVWYDEPIRRRLRRL